MVVGNAGKADVWVSICVCFGMSWFQGSQAVTSFETPNFLGWCSQEIWRDNERASPGGESPKSTALTWKLNTGWALSRDDFPQRIQAAHTAAAGMSHTSPLKQLGFIFSDCCWICNGNFPLVFNLSLNKVIVLPQSPRRQGEKYFPNNYCSQLSWAFESNRHLKIYNNSNLLKYFILEILFGEKSPCSLYSAGNASQLSLFSYCLWDELKISVLDKFT